MKNSTKFIIFLAIGLTAFFYYRHSGNSELEKLRQELATVMAEQGELRFANQELEELTGQYSIRADMADFIEHLYLFARQTGIKDHQLVTRDKNITFGQRSAGGSNNSRQTSSGLEINSLEIVLTGGYRNIAEYVKLVQEIDSPKRITQLLIMPAKDTLQLKMNLELYSYEAGNGS